MIMNDDQCKIDPSAFIPKAILHNPLSIPCPVCELPDCVNAQEVIVEKEDFKTYRCYCYACRLIFVHEDYPK
jgi:hypothetical protein